MTTGDLLLPVGGKDALCLVVAGKTVDTALDENETEFGVLVLRSIDRRQARLEAEQ